ncbi:MAG: HAD family hydrolase [Armatimonadetes bacterium]|nr:HAD family hydrolase [Armatimonadota bacterium]
MRYRAVYFDAGDTLLTGTPWVERTLGALAEIGISLDRAVVEEAAVKARAWFELAGPRPRTLDEEMKIWPEYYRFVARTLGVADGDGAVAAHLFRRCFWPHVAFLFPEALKTLDTLRADGVRVGLISNAAPSMQTALDRLALTPRLDAIIISDVVGVAKPDLAIYRLALETLAVPAAASVFVDDLDPNVRAAEDLGMTGLLIDRAGRYPDTACRRIADLREVLTLLR